MNVAKERGEGARRRRARVASAAVATTCAGKPVLPSEDTTSLTSKSCSEAVQSASYAEASRDDHCFRNSHTVLALLGTVLTLLLLLRFYYYGARSDVVSNVKLGLAASSFVFVAFGTVQLPDSLLVRPHPAVWRAVLACGVIYFVLLTFLLFQDLATVRQLVGYYDPALRLPLPERAYAEDCRVFVSSWPFVRVSQSFDVFIVAHAVGYVVKTFILRDWRLVTCLSVGFEVAEVTFQHVLPNFRECWWDHLVLDVLLCNGGGTVVGMWLLRRLRAKRYGWIVPCGPRTVMAKTRSLLCQLGPRHVDDYHWNVFDKPARFFQVLGILLLALTQELNCFTMKAILNIPPKHHLVTLRLAFWGLLAMPAIREYYEYVSCPGVSHIGTTAWVGTLGLTLETIWIAKLAVEGHYFSEPMPEYIALPWIAALAFFALWLVLFFGLLSAKTRRGRRGWGYHCSNVLLYAACLCILALFLMGLPDLQLGRHAFEQRVAPHARWLLVWRH